MELPINNTKVILAEDGVAAGTGDEVVSAYIDTNGANVLEFETVIGAITATGTAQVKLKHSDAANGAGAEDIAGSAIDFTDADDNKIARHSLFKFKKRYVAVAVERATANVVVTAIIARLHGLRVNPVTQDATVKGVKDLTFALSGEE